MTVFADNSEVLDDQVTPVSVIEAVWSRLNGRIEDRLSKVELIVSYLFERPLELAEIEAAAELASTVASTFGVLGLSAGADLLRKVADALEVPNLGVQDAIAISSMLEDARIAAASMVAEIKMQRHTGVPIAIVGEESELVDTLVWVSYAQGLPVVRHDDGMATALQANQTVGGVLVVADQSDGSKSRSVVRSVRETYPIGPVVVVTPTSNVDEISALAPSVTLILPAAVHPLDMVSELRKAMVRATYEPTVALVGVNATRLADPLADRGFIVDTTEDVAELIEASAKGICRAVIIGGDVGSFSALEVLRMLHTDRRTRSTVVVLVAQDASVARSHHALRSGADLYVPADVDVDDLSVTLRSLLGRRADREPVAEQASKLGLLPWRSAKVMVDRMLMDSFRRHQPVAVGMLDLPPLKVDGKNVDDLIVSEFRNEDVISRIDDDHLVVVLQGVNEKIMQRRMQDIHRKYGLGERNGHAAVVGFPADGRSLDDLIFSARSLLVEANEKDGPAVVSAGWNMGSSAATDILMVDPDETLGAVLAATLNRRGVKVELQPDALYAMDHLTGVAGKPYPRVVILELDLLGVDGLQFLRSLREAGTMDRFKVIVLSTRSRESDLRQAFELGVEDYVSKPFSTPLLMHRLGRLLDLQ